MLRIPKIFHRIWVGEKPMPDEFVEFGRSWRELHPGWVMIEWNRPEQLQPLVNASHIGEARNAAQLSDVLRYEVLHRFGGVYLDTDFICQKNIEPLLQDADFVGAGEKPDMVSAGFIAAVPSQVVIKAALAMLPSRITSRMHQASATGPGLLTEAWRPYRFLPEVVAYGPELFYPYPWTEKHRRHEAFPDAYAIHHWAGSWL